MNYDDWKLATPDDYEDKESMLLEQINKLDASTDILSNKIECLNSLLVKAEQKLNKITNSECLIYKMAGGYFEKQKDILFAESVKNRISKYIESLEREFQSQLESMYSLERELNRI